MVICHVGSYYYDDSKWPLTHPRQLAALSLRRDADQENRWLCWGCNLPVEGADAHDTGKTAYKTPVDQCYHWWQHHATDGQWEWLEEGMALGVTMPEVMYSLGVDVYANPYPQGTALDRLPTYIPSRPWKLHDERLFKAPWNLRKTPITARSEVGLPWAPYPPSYPPPSWALDSSSKKASNAQSSPPQTYSTASTGAFHKKGITTKEATEKYLTNQERIRIAKTRGFTIQPGAEELSTVEVTTLGWIDPLDILYYPIRHILQDICAGCTSVGHYGDTRVAYHKKHFGDCKLAAEFLKLEEHAFYVLSTKIAATMALTNPDALDEQQKKLTVECLDFQPSILQNLLKEFVEAELIVKSLSTIVEYELVVKCIQMVCLAPIPVNSTNAPRAPGESGKLTKSQQAALLM